MKKYIACILLVAFPSLVSAQDYKPKDIPPGNDNITFIRKGEAAIYEGQLFDSATALRWGNWLLQYKFQLVSQGEYQKRLFDIEVSYWNKVVSLERDRYQRVTTEYQSQVAKQQEQLLKLQDEVRNPPFFRSVWFGVLVGVVVTGLSFGVGAALVAK
jgi:hypothetical protein